MMNPSLAANLVAERQHRLHAEADSWRLVRQARHARRAALASHNPNSRPAQ